MNIKKILKLILLALAMLFAYEAVAVYKARSVTIEKFNNILNSKEMELSLEVVSQQRVDDLLKVQDPKFFEHSGIDFNTAGAGLTTITQAMVKYLYFEKFRSGMMKIEQSLIAWLAVNPMISKQDQLTVFINTAYFGTIANKAVKGFAQAANIYFDKSFEQLSQDEYLALVAMLIAPDGYSVKNHPEKIRRG